jgi:predicted transcriptional regulator
MTTVKERVSEIVQAQPDDSSFDEILRELACSRMVERGLADSREGRTISNEEMAHRIRTWQK